MRSRGLATVFLAAPTSTDQRLRRIAKACSGFVYAVSRTGVTGERQELAADARQLVGRLRRTTKLPIAVGFGISTPAQAATVAGLADGVVVGSALVDALGKGGVGEAVSFLRSLREAVDGVGARR
jgi:tryptophan synthase alpha chain